MRSLRCWLICGIVITLGLAKILLKALLFLWFAYKILKNVPERNTMKFDILVFVKVARIFLPRSSKPNGMKKLSAEPRSWFLKILANQQQGALAN